MFKEAAFHPRASERSLVPGDHILPSLTPQCCPQPLPLPQQGGKEEGVMAWGWGPCAFLGAVLNWMWI